MRKYKKTRNMVKGASRLFVTVFLVSAMVIMFALPVMTQLTAAEAVGAAVITDGSAAEILPLMMQMPEEPASRDIRILPIT